MKYCDVVEYNGAQLFSGAIDIDNFLDAPERTKDIVSSYIFHGKENHEGSESGQKLTDSITFTETVIEALASESPEMLIAIAGYGVGKSHLALTLSVLLSNPYSPVSQRILDKIKDIDEGAAKRIEDNLNQDERPYLVVPINGMRNASLKDLFFATIKRVLLKDGVDSSCLDSFDPRFVSLKEILLNYNDEAKVVKLLTELGFSKLSFAAAMDRMDREAFESVTKACEKYEISFFQPAAIGEIKDIISAVAETLCGEDKPYRAMLIVFDEIGKYMSFAASNEGTAGPGCMQLLFEGIQNHQGKDGHVVLLGLSQLDFKDYQRGIGDIAFSNTMSRYVTRFDSAKRYYLSACFETLLANLIHVKNENILPSFENIDDQKTIAETQQVILSRFVQANNLAVWKNKSKFISLICRGCWPLSPYLVWTLSYITSVNNLLQQRSCFNLVANLFEYYINDQETTQTINAVSLFSAGLLEEFLNSERTYATSDPIATEYQFFTQKYNHKLTDNERAVLQAIVLTHKLIANCKNKDTLDYLIAELTAISKREVTQAIKSLSETYNCVRYDANMGLYEIHSDSVSISEFDNIVKKHVQSLKMVSSPDELFKKVAEVFTLSSDITDIKTEFLADVECDFATENSICTTEWRYTSSLVFGYDYLRSLDTQISIADITKAVDYDTPKGHVYYVILPKSESVAKAKSEIKDLLAKKAEEYGSIVPAMILLIQDEKNVILDSCIEISIIDNFSEADSEKFATLIPRRKERLFADIRTAVEDQVYKRNYVYPEGISSNKQLKVAGSLIFEEIYPSIIPFYVDGRSWMSYIQRLIELFSRGNIVWNDILNIGDKAFADRAESLLNKQWKILNSKGKFDDLPGQSSLKEIFLSFDSRIIENGEAVPVYNLYQELLKRPYGANTTSATVIFFLYISVRSGLIDLFVDNTLLDVSLFVVAKGNIGKNKELIKKSWVNIVIKKSVRDDVQWTTLISKWEKEKDLLTLIQYKQDAKALSNSNITIPPTWLDRYNGCVKHSTTAEEIYSKWVGESAVIKADIERAIASEKMDFVLSNYTYKYQNLYKATLGKGQYLSPSISVSERILSEEEGFNSFLTNYIVNNIDKWQSEHPLKFDVPKDEFNTAKDIYTRQIKNFEQCDNETFALLANDLQYDVDNESAKHTSYNDFKVTRREVKRDLERIDEQIKRGLYTSEQVSSVIRQLSDNSKKISSFSQKKLNMIVPYNFNDLSNEINEKILSVKDIGNQKDEEFANLFDLEIKSIDDLDMVIVTTSDLISFYKGLGDIKNENLVDAQAMKKEAELLKKAYYQMKDSALSVGEIQGVSESYKDLIDRELDGDSTFADDEILDLFKAKFEEEINDKASSWVKNQTALLNNCESIKDIDKVLFALEEAPSFTVGVVDDEIKDLTSTALSLRGKKNLEYLKSLFNDLTAEEKKEFLDWCRLKG